MVIKPDLLIASESMGIVVVVDTMQNLRDKEIKQYQEKIEIIDNYIYTSLMKNRSLKRDARSLKINVVTIGYCPNLSLGLDSDNIFSSTSGIIEYIENLGAKCEGDVLTEAIASLEQATALIKPKERILSEDDKDTKAQFW